MYNKTIMVGNLTRDIELKYLPSGSAVAKSSIASSYKYKSETGEQKEEVCYLEFNIFGRSAEVANQYLKKGSKVLLEGRLVIEKWTAQDGSSRSKHSLRVETMKMLDSKGSSDNNSGNNSSYDDNYYNSESGNYQSSHQNERVKQNIPDIDIEDEIPF
ncbi:single-stranded DNA-binding protein [Aliarcobacter butzleri]|uniref:single-stranded DNA-binding protein n=1 Tax=Aliarcobacter butzleri TaxID=28197 RepID=UPI00126A73DE|nr:single-stranded DNA-binding protein [Aliarcobacter butzleri]